MWATGNAKSLQLIGTFKPCNACALGRAKMARVSKMAITYSTVKGQRSFIDISSTATVSMGGKKHWLLLVEDSTIMCGATF